MMNAVCYRADSGRIAGPRLRCFLNATLLPFLIIGASGATMGYAATCPALAEMHLARLQGTVYGPSGVAVPQIVVRVEQDGKLVAQTQTDDHGRFEFKVAPGNYVVHVQFLGTKSLDLNVRIGHHVEFFRSARIRIVLGLSGTKCSFATTSSKQFKNQLRRSKQQLEEVTTGP